MGFWRVVWGIVGVVGLGAGGMLACDEGGSGGTASPGAGVDGGPGGTGTPPGPAATAAPGNGRDFCAKTLGVVVGALEACCTADDKATTDYTFTHGIAAAVLPVCTLTLEESIAKKRVLYRSAEGDACFAAYQRTYGPGTCSTITQTYADPSGPSCRQAFTGTGAAGAPCLGDHECTEGLTCVGYTAMTDGACRPPPAIGSACGPARAEAGAGSSGAASLEFGDHPTCAAGARCDLATRTCVAATGAGGTCTSDATCATPLVCVVGKCASARGGEGATCRDTDDCLAAFFCDAPAPSGPTPTPEGTCQKKKPAGATCTGAAFVSACAGRCNAAIGATGTCATFCGSP